MSSSEQPRSAPRARTALVVSLALAVAAVVGAVLGYVAVPDLSPSAASPLTTSVGGGPGTGLPWAPAPGVPGGATIDDGVVPGDVTVFDDDVPAVADLDPDLLAALRRAATAAAADGVEFTVNSGWRSRSYQDQLLREAVSEYGSEEEAARWVATADTSAHVSGDGVDIGPTDAMSWLSQHGADHGLCQIYGNEPWHYELRPEAVDHGCPRMYDDPTQDPRMQQ
jgi:hypothetical protein